MVLIEKKIFLKAVDKDSHQTNILSLNPIKSMKGISGKIGLNKIVQQGGNDEADKSQVLMIDLAASDAFENFDKFEGVEKK